MMCLKTTVKLTYISNSNLDVFFQIPIQQASKAAIAGNPSYPHTSSSTVVMTVGGKKLSNVRWMMLHPAAVLAINNHASDKIQGFCSNKVLIFSDHAVPQRPMPIKTTSAARIPVSSPECL